jgi:hypothetical protein
MAKVWILDTETKGTGANVVPLEKVSRKPAPEPEPLSVPRKPRPRPAPAPEPPPPPEFKVVDLMTRETLVEGANARETVAALRPLRSVVDVNVYARRRETEEWRLLTLEEQRALWRLRDR